MRLTIDVTENDIRMGRKENEAHCPVARAAKRALREKKVKGYTVTVPDPNYILLDDAKGWEGIRVPLPAKAQKFISTFDTEGKKAVKPFTFTINVKEIR